MVFKKQYRQIDSADEDICELMTERAACPNTCYQTADSYAFMGNFKVQKIRQKNVNNI